mmetsp:Transcript_2966/g.6985  ORF Transcript_2966/g.6985 Transcript_2966/m.6985 type:complete len:81 (-) Transcript_2966:775-1017(-)
MSSEPKMMSDPTSVKIGGKVAPEFARSNEYAAPIKPGKKSAISRKIACCMLNLISLLIPGFDESTFKTRNDTKPEKGTAL